MNGGRRDACSANSVRIDRSREALLLIRLGKFDLSPHSTSVQGEVNDCRPVGAGNSED